MSRDVLCYLCHDVRGSWICKFHREQKAVAHQRLLDGDEAGALTALSMLLEPAPSEGEP